MGVVMVQEHGQSTNVKTIAFVLLTLSLHSEAANIRPKREAAGFYTTRFGRSDPMMRFRETHTSYFPEAGPLDYPNHRKPVSSPLAVGTVGGTANLQSLPSLLCDFSLRKQAYTCRPTDQLSPWKKSENLSSNYS